MKLPIEKSDGIFGDNSGIPKNYFSIYSYWDEKRVGLDQDYGASAQVEFYMSLDEEKKIYYE